jgi:protein phosphatase 1L
MHREFSCKRKEKQSDNGSATKGNVKNKIQFERDITEYFLANNSNGDIDFPKLIRDAISSVDKLLIQQAKKSMQIGGTTLLLAILDCSSSVLWVANVGASRGVLSNSSSVPKGEVMPLSFDHKPSQLKERRRIEEAGGFVAMNGVWRVQGILATSRALGDFPLKDKNLITCEPDILSFR